MGPGWKLTVQAAARRRFEEVALRGLWMIFRGAALVLAGCQTGPTADRGAEPLFDGMGPHHRTVTTASTSAQRYFDQGLNWAYAFNHDEAIKSFTECARLDPG